MNSIDDVFRKELMKKDFVLITGGTGSLGKALALNLVKNNHVRIYSRNEERQFELEQIFMWPYLHSKRQVTAEWRCACE
jgi:FlaA1/EpsC-like NDP-sugar epimerase